jgi:parallel beta-helix repeat protein
MTLRKPRITILVAILTVLAGCLSLTLAGPARAAGASYYVDCSAASNGDGSLAAPWNNLTTVNGKTFTPGDSLLFARGTTCSGSFVFSSSGTSSSPITIGAYGTGALPAIDGTGQNRAVKLLDTSYVTMQDLEVKNSRVWGILATTDHDAPAVGITLRNLVVHHVTGGDYTAMSAKWTGLVVFAPGMIVEPDMTKGSGTYTRKSYFDNVLVDNVTAYDTTLWGGIFVWGVQVDQDFQWKQDSQNQALQSRNITIQNSTVHNTYGDGIAIYMSHEGTIQNDVVYQSGMQPPPVSTGTPVGLWWWSSENMVGQGNESYDNHSPGVDGGGYDIDYGSTNSTMQYNYGHANSTYCTSVFGSGGTTTTNIIRYNICAGDGTVHTYLKSGTVTTMPGDSEIYLCTWAGGKLANTWIYNNTFYINSTGQTAGLISDGCSSGSDHETGGIFKNNLVTSAIPNVLGDLSVLNNRARDYNLYFYTGGTFTDPNPEPHGIYNQDPLVNGLGYDGTGRPTTQWTLQPGSPAINHGTDACAGLTGCTTGTRDFFGNQVPLGGAFDIGADEAG